MAGGAEARSRPVPSSFDRMAVGNRLTPSPASVQAQDD